MQRPFLRLALALPLASLLIGCTLGNNAELGPEPFAVAGTVMGGSLPVNSPHIYLFAAGTGGSAGPGITASSANASISLIKSVPGITTADANGNYYVTAGTTGQFSLTGDYTACTASQQLYLYASGGNATGTGTMNNSAIGLLADLGACGSTPTKVTLNEISTVAAAYSLSGFATDAIHISDDENVSTNLTGELAKTGMANAFANAANLISSGAALTTTPAGNGTLPVATMNTIANILAGCVQSTASNSKPCSDLFTFTGTALTADTATAAINLAHNPVGVSGTSISIATLFGDIEPQTAFTPNLSTAPNDFTLAIHYPTSGNPVDVAVDKSGNVWVASQSSGSAQLQQFTAPGYTLNQNVKLTGSPATLAIDLNQNVWVDGLGSANVNKVVPSGSTSTVTPYTYSGNGTLAPGGIAIDSTNSVWVGDKTSQEAIQFGNTGSFKAQTINSLNTPYGVAIDGSGDLWVADLYGPSLVFFKSPSFASTTFTDANLVAAYADAIDSFGNVWVTGSAGISRFSGTGTNYSSTYFTGIGGLDYATSIPAVDGDGNIWIPNSRIPNKAGTGYVYGYLVKLSNSGTALSPASGFTSTTGTSGGVSGPFNSPFAAAVDGSGNVWCADLDNASLIELVGAATPVVTPIAEGTTTNKLGTRP